MNFINAQFAKILLGVAVVITIVSSSYHTPQPLEPIEERLLKRDVMVTLDRNALAVASAETYFAPGEGEQYALPQVAVFVRPKVVKEFQPVLLELPPATIMRPPQILPEGGPSLEGSHTLPRWGEEFGPVTLTPEDTRPTRPGAGAAGNARTTP